MDDGAENHNPDADDLRVVAGVTRLVDTHGHSREVARLDASLRTVGSYSLICAATRARLVLRGLTEYPRQRWLRRLTLDPITLDRRESIADHSN